MQNGSLYLTAIIFQDECLGHAGKIEKGLIDIVSSCGGANDDSNVITLLLISPYNA